MTKIKGFLVAADAIVRCNVCGAIVGEPCKNVPGKGKKRSLSVKPGQVHIGRRIKRLLLTARRPERREALEAELVELLAKVLHEGKVT